MEERKKRAEGTKNGDTKREDEIKFNEKLEKQRAKANGTDDLNSKVKVIQISPPPVDRAQKPRDVRNVSEAERKEEKREKERERERERERDREKQRKRDKTEEPKRKVIEVVQPETPKPAARSKHTD